MLRLVLLCAVGVALGQEAQEGASSAGATNPRTGQGQNTRIFGLGNLANTAGAVLGAALNPAAHHGGFNPNLAGGGFNPNVAAANNAFPGCRHYCRTPENQFYCCETSLDPPSTNVFKPPVVKPGRCPLIRPQCPNVVRIVPNPCSSDTSCGLGNPLKCCFDRCLEQHVCKSPDPTFGVAGGAFQGGFPGGFQGGFQGGFAG